MCQLCELRLGRQYDSSIVACYDINPAINKQGRGVGLFIKFFSILDRTIVSTDTIGYFIAVTDPVQVAVINDWRANIRSDIGLPKLMRTCYVPATPASYCNGLRRPASQGIQNTFMGYDTWTNIVRDALDRKSVV